MHRIEVGRIRKQISSIQDKSNSKQINDDLAESQMLVADGILNEDVVAHSKCEFRTDVDPRPDIQVDLFFDQINFFEDFRITQLHCPTDARRL